MSSLKRVYTAVLGNAKWLLVPLVAVAALPSECLTDILSRLPVADVVSIALTSTGLKQLAADDCVWARLAELKWGASVKDFKPTAPSAAAPPAVGQGWQQYCYRRMSARTISRSPLNLLQESYADPWQHIICCVLCSRTSGSDTIRGAIAAFFEALPTPTAVLAATDGLLQDLLHPLGLQASRMAAVRAVSRGFLATDWQSPAEFHGCGKFVEDSWRIFCRGYKDARGVSDANLKAYLAWCSRQQAGTAAGGDSISPKKNTKKRQQQQPATDRQAADQGARARKSPRLQRQHEAAAADAVKRTTRGCSNATAAAEQKGCGAVSAAGKKSAAVSGGKRKAPARGVTRAGRASASSAQASRDQERLKRRGTVKAV